MPIRQGRAVSVVLTSYNYGRFLRRALESVREQTEQDYELVVVDDGSTDDTPRVAQAFADEYPQLPVTLVRTRNGGASRARNIGIGVARGRYVTCLDADDYFAPTALADMRAVLDGDPEVGVVRPKLRVFGDVNAVWDWTVVPYDFDLLTRRNIAPCCAMFRREAWEQVGGYDESLGSWEDWDFWLSVCKRGYRMGEVMEPLLHHRMSQDGKFATNLHRHLELIAAIVRNHADVYGDAAALLAGRILAGESVEAELSDPPHPIFSWSLAAL